MNPGTYSQSKGEKSVGKVYCFVYYLGQPVFYFLISCLFDPELYDNKTKEIKMTKVCIFYGHSFLFYSASNGH